MASFAISAIRMKTSACGEKIITPMSDPNSGLKAGLDLPDNLARPRWSQFHGVCRRHGRNCQPCWYKVRGKPVLCSRWGELLWSCPHPECVSSTQAPSCTAALPASSALTRAGGPGQTWSLHRCFGRIVPGILAWASPRCMCLMGSVTPVTS